MAMSGRNNNDAKSASTAAIHNALGTQPANQRGTPLESIFEPMPTPAEEKLNAALVQAFQNSLQTQPIRVAEEEKTFIRLGKS